MYIHLYTWQSNPPTVETDKDDLDVTILSALRWWRGYCVIGIFFYISRSRWHHNICADFHIDVTIPVSQMPHFFGVRWWRLQRVCKSVQGINHELTTADEFICVPRIVWLKYRKIQCSHHVKYKKAFTHFYSFARHRDFLMQLKMIMCWYRPGYRDVFVYFQGFYFHIMGLLRKQLSRGALIFMCCHFSRLVKQSIWRLSTGVDRCNKYMALKLASKYPVLFCYILNQTRRTWFFSVSISFHQFQEDYIRSLKLHGRHPKSKSPIIRYSDFARSLGCHWICRC